MAAPSYRSLDRSLSSTGTPDQYRHTCGQVLSLELRESISGGDVVEGGDDLESCGTEDMDRFACPACGGSFSTDDLWAAIGAYDDDRDFTDSDRRGAVG